jgi:toxin secretion/phage lysis holin
MGMIDWLGQWLNNENTKIIYVLMCIMGANIIDFFLGWINAKFNKDVKFSSSKAIYGIARKMVMFMLCVFFIPVVPEPMGIGALYVMFIGYLVSELTSILNHLKLASDDKTTDMFMDFVNRLFNKK